LIHRIRERSAFERLARDGTRIRRSALWCTWCPDPDSTATCVAFAFSRAFGPAVHRNRIRRRLRSILTELDREQTLPPGLLLINGRPPLLEHTFDRLRAETADLVTQLRATVESKR
jgi:ribonuclease P protein component